MTSRSYTISIHYRRQICTATLFRHPSETPQYLLARALVYALHFQPGLRFSSALCHGRKPTLYRNTDNHQLHTWIDVRRSPDAKRLRRAQSLAQEVYAYYYGHLGQCRKLAAGLPRSRAQLFWIEPAFLRQAAVLLQSDSRQFPWQLEQKDATLRLNEFSGSLLQLSSQP